jgi:hypothetical protein
MSSIGSKYLSAETARILLFKSAFVAASMMDASFDALPPK